MEESELNDLRSRYPQEFFKVSEKDGKLVVAERRAAIWLPDRFLVKLPAGSPAKLGEFMLQAIEECRIGPEFFRVTQKRITAKAMNEIANRARECNVTRKEFIAALLEKRFGRRQ